MPSLPAYFLNKGVNFIFNFSCYFVTTNTLKLFLDNLFLVWGAAGQH